MALKLGIVRDDRFLEHMPGHNHPEHPSRLRAVHHMLDTEFADSYDVDNATRKAIPMKRPAAVAEIAKAVAFLGSSDAAYITGQTLHVNGGMAMI